MIRRGLSAALLVPLAACAGEGIVDPTAPAPLCTDVAPFRPELHCIQQFVFTPTCAVSGCHANPGVNLGLDLSDGRAFMNTVGVTSVGDPNLSRIEPGDPDASYLLRKLRGDPTIVGDRMPFGGPFLSQAEIDVIEQWVLDGAQDN